MSKEKETSFEGVEDFVKFNKSCPRSFMDMLGPKYSGPGTVGSFGPKDKGTAKRLMASINMPDFRPREMEGETFALAHWMVTTRTYHDEPDDEGRKGLAIILFNPADETLMSGSEMIGRALEQLIKMFGPGPYDPPKKLRFSPTQTQGGRPTYRVDLDD